MNTHIKDSDKGHWVNRSPQSIRPYLQLSRLDRPVGYWLLALPGWIGLAFATLSHGFATSDLKWAVLILIGAIAMRGAGCTYNDIVDQDLDRQVERTALRPLPAGTVTTKQAWIWLFAQCGVGLIVLLCLPRLAQIISLCSIPLVAAYPFMKRITWWPQLWLGLTFNWAVLVAYAAKTGTVSVPLLILYTGLIFWTVGYDTIYACQDIEDDMKIGVKSTARRFEGHVIPAVGWLYFLSSAFIFIALFIGGPTFTCYWSETNIHNFCGVKPEEWAEWPYWWSGFIGLGFYCHLIWQVRSLAKGSEENFLPQFKSNKWAATLLILSCLIVSMLIVKNLTNP